MEGTANQAERNGPSAHMKFLFCTKILRSRATELTRPKPCPFASSGRRAEIVSHFILAKVSRSALRCRLVQIVFDASIRAAFDQELDNRHMPGLGRHVKSRDS